MLRRILVALALLVVPALASSHTGPQFHVDQGDGCRTVGILDILKPDNGHRVALGCLSTSARKLEIATSGLQLADNSDRALNTSLVRDLLCVDRPYLDGKPCPGIVQHLRVRLGPPEVIRGPFNPESDGGDTVMVYLPKQDGTFNAFNSNQGVYRYSVTGLTTSLRNATAKLTISKNTLQPVTMGPAPGSGAIRDLSIDACGSWLQAVHKISSTWYALVHNEGPCDYSIINTNETMSVWSSANEGNTWTPLANGSSSTGMIISNPTQTPYVHASERISGEGDFGWIPGPSPDPDGSGQQYMYAYGGRYYPDWGTVIARAPINNLAPGEWRKWHNGSFSSPGLDGADTSISLIYPTRSFPGRTPIVPAGIAPVALIGQDHVQCPNPDGVSAHDVKGLTLAFSQNMTAFDVLCPDPILNYDEQEFNNRGAGSKDLYIYPVINNDLDGSRMLRPDHAILYYSWVRPGEGLDRRYIVAQRIRMTVEQTKQSPHVGVALTRYSKSSGTLFRTSAAPQDPADEWAVDAALGYVMTAPPLNGEPVNKIEECTRTGDGNIDFGIDFAGACPGNGLTRIRTVGWLYKAAVPGTKPVYSCLHSDGHTLLASNFSHCEGKGVKIHLLGYALVD